MKYAIYLFIFVMIACQSQKEKLEGKDITFRFELLNLDFSDGNSKVSMQLTNNGNTALGDSGWAIYFNSVAAPPVENNIGKGLVMDRVVGDLWTIFPSTEFIPLLSGQSVETSWLLSGIVTNENTMPMTPFIAFGEDDPGQLMNSDIVPVSEDIIPETKRPTPGYRWNENAKVSELSDDRIVKIVPSPSSYKEMEGAFTFKALSISSEGDLENEVSWFRDFMRSELGHELTTVNNGAEIMIEIDGAMAGDESYRLNIDENGVTIVSSTNTGVFYGLQSLIALIPTQNFQNKSTSLELPFVAVSDAPAFPYRGFHLDVSRNFHSMTSVKKVLRLMAFYKLNKFHLHVTDDEGWRLEIPELPELTQVGARRGFNAGDESEFLIPAYGSGPNTSNASGSGFYTQDEMVDMIRLADSLHIEVIPEIDLPGHARAAIKAMESRFKKTGDDRYRLIDPEDKSEYLSIQNYPDNVINVCSDRTYNFIELVVENLLSIYKEAGVELNILHIGGDEVPKGVWTASPECDALIASAVEVSTPGHLVRYFMLRVNDMLKSKGIRMAGWEEIVKREEDDHREDKSMIPYIWHDVDEGYFLANEGYDVVLCNASNLYFDMAYDQDPEEPGFHWAGYVNTKTVFEFMPYNFRLPFNENTQEETKRTILTSQGKGHIYGIQGELWSETLIGQEMLEYYLLPKLFALSERAWFGDPGWKVDGDKVEGLEKDWSDFSNRIGKRELPRLDFLYGGWNYRIPKPGLRLDDGVVSANVSYPGTEIFYTTDGTPPTRESQQYLEPVPYVEGMIFRAIGKNGKASRSIQP